MKLFKCILALCFLASCAGGGIPSFKQAIPGVNKRLIIHSGMNASSVTPWATTVTPKDITMDFAEASDDVFLNPTYIAHPGDLKALTSISGQYRGAFSEIIIEHMGSCLHDTFTGSPTTESFLACDAESKTCYQNLYDLLKVYHFMLSPNGTLTYKSNVYSAAGANGKTDGGRDMALLTARYSIEKMFGWDPHKGLTSDTLLKYFQDFYTNMLNTYFSSVTVSIKTDDLYAKFRPAPNPWYYMEIKMQRKALPSEDPAAAPQTPSMMGRFLTGSQSPVPAGVPTPATSGFPGLNF